MAERKGQVPLTVENGANLITTTAEILDMQDGRDMVLGLDHFKRFGFEIQGVPTLPPNTVALSNSEVEVMEATSEDHNDVDGLTAAELWLTVHKALERNKLLSPAVS